MPNRPLAEALVVHLFVAADGPDRIADLAYLRAVWQACGDSLGMTHAVPGLSRDPEPGWDTGAAAIAAPSGPLAARTRPGAGVYQAALRRDRDVFCLSVMMEPDPTESAGWSELDRRWTAVAGQPTPSTLGTAQLFLARLPDPEAVESTGPAGLAELAETVQVGVPADPAAGDWVRRGTRVGGFAVWEVSARVDTRPERRLVVLAGPDADRDLSGWTWVGAGQGLPPLAAYLLHAAKLRYQMRVWGAGQGFRRLRREADATIARLLAAVAPARRKPGLAELVDASRDLASLQARELGLVDGATRLREMRRTVEIAGANLAGLSDGCQFGGLFAEDRALAEWFGHQLDDDATYLEAALRRSEQVGALVDRLLERSRQRRQESVNLGLTGALGAILMSLAAVQSLQYTVPLPGPVKPAVVTTLGTLALCASLVVLRVVVPERRWSRVLVRAGVGAVVASLAWISVAALAGPASAGWSGLASGCGFLAGVAAAVGADRLRRSSR